MVFARMLAAAMALTSLSIGGRNAAADEARVGAPPGTGPAASSSPSKADDTSAADWVAEFEAPKTSSLVVSAQRVEIDTSAGATVWYKKPLSGNVVVTYDVTVVDAGGRNDRVSDLNAFWMARDAASATPFGRNGKLTAYDDLDLYYAGVGGHDNSTTRFRRYRRGEGKPILREYKDKEHLLEGNKVYSVKIVVRDGQTSFSINGVLYFEYIDHLPLTNGYFAFRTTKSRQRIENFKVE